MFLKVLALVLNAAFMEARVEENPFTTPQLNPLEIHVISRTNFEREQQGLPPLEVDFRLMSTARKHAAWMTNSRSMVHGSYGVAENIAMGQRNAPEVLQTWMNSSGHRANILNGSYTKIGVAAYSTPDGTIYWCQQFTAQ